MRVASVVNLNWWQRNYFIVGLIVLPSRLVCRNRIFPAPFCKRSFTPGLDPRRVDERKGSGFLIVKKVLIV